MMEGGRRTSHFPHRQGQISGTMGMMMRMIVVRMVVLKMIVVVVRRMMVVVIHPGSDSHSSVSSFSR